MRCKKGALRRGLGKRVLEIKRKGESLRRKDTTVTGRGREGVVESRLC